MLLYCANDFIARWSNVRRKLHYPQADTAVTCSFSLRVLYFDGL